MKNILVGYNGSGPSKNAVELSIIHAKAFNAAVTIFVSMDDNINESFSNKQAERFWVDFKEAEAELEKVKEKLKKAGISCVTQLSTTGLDPGTDIIDFAKKIAADEIIIGIEKKSKVDKFIFGSTAQKVILESKCPVLTVR